MAVVRYYVDAEFWQNAKFGDVSLQQATSTQMRIGDGKSEFLIEGSGLGTSGFGVTGTVARLVLTLDGTPAFEVSALSMPLAVLLNHLAAGSAETLFSAMLAGDDQVFGSMGDDILVGYGGSDVFEPAGGHDVINGGAGSDVVVLKGALSDYEVTKISANEFEVTRLDGSGDSYDLTGVERLRFDDNSELDLMAAPPAVDGWHTFVADVELVAATYQFFTGSIPRADGFEYLIDSPQNPNDLNDPYYEQFNVENRYINFSSNLGTEGEGAAAFDLQFGDLDFAATVKAAYLEIMGKELAGGALDFFLNAEGFYAAVAGERVVRSDVDLAEATKIVAIGSILNEAIKSGEGAYAEAIDALVADLAPDAYSTALGNDLFLGF